MTNHPIPQSPNKPPVTILERKLMDHLIQELETANQQFRVQLKSRFPNLTAYDIRLCTYLKANLSTKEIATLLNITPDSVKKAKHRLRKKIRMNPKAKWLELTNSADTQMDGDK